MTVVSNTADNPVKVLNESENIFPLLRCSLCVGANQGWKGILYAAWQKTYNDLKQDFGKQRENQEGENKLTIMSKNMGLIWRNETGKSSFTSPEDFETCTVAGSL